MKLMMFFRSLPEKFRPKVTTIEESKYLDSIKVEELIGSLQTYELTLDKPIKDKSMALKTIRVILMNLLTQIHLMRKI